MIHSHPGCTDCGQPLHVCGCQHPRQPIPTMESADSQRFTYTTRDGALSVYEALGGFYLLNQVTRELASIGDGVDQFHRENGTPIDPGSEEFYRALAQFVEEADEAMLEAYFREELSP